MAELRILCVPERQNSRMLFSAPNTNVEYEVSDRRLVPEQVKRNLDYRHLY